MLHTLGLWNDGCDCMHGATDAENKRIMKSKAVEKVVNMYEEKSDIQEGFEYMFQENIEALCQRSTQYLTKWVSSCRLAMRRGKWKEAIKPHKKKQGNKTKVQATDRDGQ